MISQTNLSLKQYIIICLTGLILFLVASYSLIIKEYWFFGMDEVSRLEMLFEAKKYIKVLEKNPQALFSSPNNIEGYYEWQTLPAWLQNLYIPNELEHNVLYVGPIPNLPDQPDQSHSDRGFHLFYTYILPDGRTLYLLKQNLRSEMEELEIQPPHDRMILKIVPWSIGLGFLIFILLVVLYILRRISRPVENMAKWAAGLSPEKIQETHPDFTFNEVNILADQLQDAMRQIHQTVEHEHRFLRHVSHELRTPIAVCLSNLELLKRVRPEPEEKEAQIFRRLSRATGNMKEITETLLLLSRDKEKVPDPEWIELGQIVEALISENQYLLEGKKVTLNLDIRPEQYQIQAVPCQIAIRNLLRNAFQYTVEGAIEISVDSDRIIIKNINTGENAAGHINQDYGYGLGLDLVKQITDRFGWDYQNTPIPGGHHAEIRFSNTFSKRQDRKSNI
jgi:signal transduction histidine kinase